MDNASQEMVDIVDENDIVLCQADKKEAHKKGLLHRTVISEIKDSQGNWVLTKQASDRQDSGQYVSPIGGHALAGESEDDALRRETLEEFGFTPVDFRIVGKAIFNRYVLNRQENHYFILYEIYTDQKEFAINHESESYKTFTTQELKERLQANPKDFGDAFRFVVKTFYPELLQ